MTDEAKELTITREKIKAIMRAAIAEGLNANRMSHTAYDYGVDRRLEDIAKTKTVDVEILLMAALERKGKHPAWPAMVTVVEDTHRPSSYAKDFYYHDRESLEQRQPRVFAWAVRDTGTWLFIPGMGDDSCLDMARAAHKTEPHDWYWWNGRDLTAVDATMALAKLADHERKLARHATGGQDR